MNPDNTYQPEVDLPKPLAGSSAAESMPAPAASFVEQASIGAELPQQSPSAPAPQQSTPLPSVPVDPVITQSAQTQSMTAATQAGSLTATDADLIEKEWVTKAKAIIEKTKDNPHEQTKDMSKFKADYVKKRYNKELKVAEG